MDPNNKDTLLILNGAHIIGIHINQDTLLMTGNVGHFTLTMSYSPYFTGTDLISLWRGFLPCISHTRWAMKCSESRVIAQAQEEGHRGGYIAMTLTFKMATTSK